MIGEVRVSASLCYFVFFENSWKEAIVSIFLLLYSVYRGVGEGTRLGESFIHLPYNRVQTFLFLPC